MGIGDNIMASGMARGAAARGKKIAFGDGIKIKWDQHSDEVFRYNPNIARPGEERFKNLEWIGFYKGSRIYNSDAGGRWAWNLDFRPVPGELFFTAAELRYAKTIGTGFVLIEPNVPNWKKVAPNKQWPVERFEDVARQLKARGLDVVQPFYKRAMHRLSSARIVQTADFRHAAAALGRAALYIGPEGGMHHAAAAMNVSAVVLFGGFIPPQVTGYDTHANLTGGAEPCGRYEPCEHCRDAMAKISVEDVMQAADGFLGKAAA